MKTRRRIAVTGTTGRVGAALARHLAARHEVIELPKSIFDLADRAQVSAVLETLDCDVFLNPAGMTQVDACEENPRAAMMANSRGPGKIAEWASRKGVRLIHFSTDYVFGGESERLLDESEPPAPINAYGRSKLAGERAVLAFPGNLVLRVSWVFGPEKPSFVDAIFSAALAGQPLSAIADKTSLPTSTFDLAGWVEELLATDAEGVFHLCPQGAPVSWHGIAQLVVSRMVANGTLQTLPAIAPLGLAQMHSFRAKRPHHTALDSSRLAAVLGHPLRPWQFAVEEYVAALAARQGTSTSTITGK